MSLSMSFQGARIFSDHSVEIELELMRGYYAMVHIASSIAPKSWDPIFIPLVLLGNVKVP